MTSSLWGSGTPFWRLGNTIVAIVAIENSTGYASVAIKNAIVAIWNTTVAIGNAIGAIGNAFEAIGNAMAYVTITRTYLK